MIEFLYYTALILIAAGILGLGALLAFPADPAPEDEESLL